MKQSIFFNRWVLTIAAIAVLIARFFWSELVMHSTDGFQGAAARSELQVGLTDQQLANVKGYRLAPLTNNIAQIQVRNVRVVERDDATRTLAFDLVSDVPGNAYPALQVRLMSADGQVVRAGTVPPASYVHGQVLVDEEIRLRVPIVPGASRASIVPTYDARAS